MRRNDRMLVDDLLEMVRNSIIQKGPLIWVGGVLDDLISMAIHSRDVTDDGFVTRQAANRAEKYISDFMNNLVKDGTVSKYTASWDNIIRSRATLKVQAYNTYDKMIMNYYFTV